MERKAIDCDYCKSKDVKEYSTFTLKKTIHLCKECTEDQISEDVIKIASKIMGAL